MGGYYLYKWLNGGEEPEKSEMPLLRSGSIGESLNSLTGGRLTGFMESARAEKDKGDTLGVGDQASDDTTPSQTPVSAKAKEKPGQQSNVQPGPRAGQQKSPQAANTSKPQQSPAAAVNAPVSKVTKATGVDGKAKTVTNATGVVKGGLSGATGLG